MLAKCRTCFYFSHATSDCMKFGKKFVEEFCKAVECRMDETKCGAGARWYLEKKKDKKSNEVDLSRSRTDLGK
jgi:hypothetical protein